MRSFKIGTLVVALVAGAAPALVACSGGDHGSAREAAGTLNMDLSGTGSSGAKYRLRNATFTVSGPKAATLSSETNVDSPVIKQELPAGNYLITLKTGWTLEKSSDGGMTFANVKAVLTSANPAGFNITDQGQTTVAYKFNAGDDVVQLGDGTLNVVIDVNDGCATGQTTCGGACVDLNSDPQNCGLCGNSCGNAMGGPSQCVMGQCQQVCSAAFTLCNGVCVDTFNDPQNCGACGAVCQANMGAVAQCQMGTCVQTCFAGQTSCGGVCVNLTSDPLNCGGCGITCGAGQACNNGVCGGGGGGAVSVLTSFIGMQTSPNACQDFLTFQGALGAGPYNSINFKSEFAFFNCTGMEAQVICQALRTGTPLDIPCAGQNWHVGSCGGPELTVDNSVCACSNPGAAYRPCIGTPDWGGVGTNTCAPPSQTISVTCSP